MSSKIWLGISALIFLAACNAGPSKYVRSTQSGVSVNIAGSDVEGNSSGINPSSEVGISLDTAVVASTITPSTVYIAEVSDSLAATAGEFDSSVCSLARSTGGTPHVGVSGKTIAIQGAALRCSHRYAACLTNEILLANGAFFTGATISFSTRECAPSIGLVQGSTVIANAGSYDFANVEVNTTRTSTFTIVNVGSDPLTVSSIGLSGAGAASFSVSAFSETALALGESVTFDVTYAPTALVSSSASISIVSDDPDTANYSFSITGNAITGPQILSMSPSGGHYSTLPTSIVVTLDKAVLPASISNSDLQISGTCAGVTGSVALSSGNTVATWTLSGTGSCLNAETIILQFDPASVVDTIGLQGYGSPQSITFTKDTSPQVSSFSPATGARASIPATVTVNFTEDLNGSTVAVTDFSLSGSTCGISPTLSSASETSPGVVTISLIGGTCAHNSQFSIVLAAGSVADTDGVVNVGTATVTYTIDSVGPSVSSFSPATSTRNSIPSTVLVNFSEDINGGLVDPADFSLSASTCTTAPTISSATETSAGVVTLSLSGGTCATTQQLVISALSAAFADLSGNTNSSVQSVTYTFDVTGPTVNSISPATGSRSSVPSSVTFNFSEDLQGSTVATTDFSLAGSTCTANPTISAAVESSAGVVTLSLTGGTCTAGQDLVISVTNGTVEDPYTNGNTGGGTVTYTIDTVAPGVQTFVPASSTRTSVPSSIVLTMTEDIQAATVSGADFNLTGSTCTTSPSISSAFRSASAEITVTFSGGSCATSQQLQVNIINGGILDLAGNVNAGGGSVIYLFDLVGPNVSSFLPLAATRNSIPSTVSVTFTEDIDAGSLQTTDFSLATSTCTITPGISGVSESSAGVAAVTLAGGSCTSGQNLIMVVNKVGITDEYGNAGTGTSSVTYVFDTTGPDVNTFAPAAGTVNTIPSSVALNMTEDINPSSIATTDFTFATSTCTTNPTVSSATRTSSGVITVALTGGTCTDGQNLVLNLVGNSVADLYGNTNPGPTSVTFVFDTVAPDVSSPSPAAGSTSASIPSSVVLTMTEDLNGSTVQTTDFNFTGTTCTVNPTVSAATESSAGVITVSLSGGTCTTGQNLVLRLAASSITDLVGNTNALYSVTYHFDTTGPSVSSFSPVTSTVGAIPATVTVNFTEDLTGASVGTGDFVFTGSTCTANPTVSAATETSAGVVTVSLSGGTCTTSQQLILVLSSGAVTDIYGNANSGTASVIYTFDTTSPSVTSFSPAAGTRNNIPSTVTVNFDEDLNGGSVATGDFVFTGSTCTANPTVSAATETSAGVVTVSLSGGTCTTGQQLVLVLSDASVADPYGNNNSGTSSVTYVFDTTPPGVSSFSPSTGTRNNIPASVLVNFDEDLNGSSVATGDFVFTGSTCTANPTVSAASETSAGVVTVSLSGGTCTTGQQLVLVLSDASVADPYGNNNSGTASVTYTFDTTVPSVQSFTPSASTRNTIPSDVILVFDEDISAGTVGTGDFVFTGSTCTANPTVSAASRTANSQVTVSLSGGTCTTGQQLVVVLSNGAIEDLYGNANSGAASVTYNFDTTSPTVQSFSPSAATLNAIPTTVDLTFDEDILGASVATGDFVFTGSTCTANPTIDSATRTGNSVVRVTMSGGTCTTGQQLILVLSDASITDIYGNANSGTASVTYDFDTTAPGVSSFSPSAATFNSIPASVDVTFDEIINAGSVGTGDFVFTGSTCTTNPTVSGATVNTPGVVTVTLSGGTCTTGEQLVLVLSDASVVDLHGNANSGTASVTYDFDTTAPGVSSIVPADETRTTIPATIVFNFDEDIAGGSVATGDFVFTGSTCTANPSIDTASRTGSGEVTLTLSGGTCTDAQQLVVELSDASIDDDYGNSNSGTASVTYTFDLAGPSVSSFNPAAGTRNDIPSVITVNFDEDLDGASIDPSDFAFTGSTCNSNPIISTAFESSPGVITMSLVLGSCTTGQQLVVELSDASIDDDYGNSNSGTASVTYNFDTTVPSVSSFNPAAGTRNNIPSTVTVNFDEDLNAGSVGTGDFVFTGSTCTTNPTVSSATETSPGVITVGLAGGTCTTGEQLVLVLSDASIADVYGNTNSGTASVTYNFDTTAPGVSGFSPATSTVNAIPASIDVTFDEDLNGGSVATGDFGFAGSTCTTNPTVDTATESAPGVITVTLTGGSCLHGEQLVLVLANAAVADLYGNTNSGSSSATYTFDTVGPTVQTWNPDSGEYSGAALAIDLTFDEAATGLDASDITVTPTCISGTASLGSITSYSAPDTTATLNIDITDCSDSADTIEVEIDLSGLTDDLTNAGVGSDSRTYNGPSSFAGSFFMLQPDESRMALQTDKVNTSEISRLPVVEVDFPEPLEDKMFESLKRDAKLSQENTKKKSDISFKSVEISDDKLRVRLTPEKLLSYDGRYALRVSDGSQKKTLRWKVTPFGDVDGNGKADKVKAMKEGIAVLSKDACQKTICALTPEFEAGSFRMIGDFDFDGQSDWAVRPSGSPDLLLFKGRKEAVPDFKKPFATLELSGRTEEYDMALLPDIFESLEEGLSVSLPGQGSGEIFVFHPDQMQASEVLHLNDARIVLDLNSRRVLDSH